MVNETLRLFPAAFTLVRETIAQDRAGAVDLPPRPTVMISPWVLHRHHAHWQDPGVFKPARFMPDQPAPARFAFMPFGAGPRICVGAQFATAEAMLVLAGIVGRFRVTRTDAKPVIPIGIVTTQPDHAAKAVLTLRDDDAENAFAVLAVKELAPGVKTIAGVNDARHLAKIRRVQPDMLFAPQLLGSDLLARTLLDEPIDNETVSKLLFAQN
ncbi:voltage-gated potassium channel Kch [mine drainage metagenome]|uniref:Voltage-gated potassium channel Kch n=1 Tax=mine drainage metagenome TaxID=410659 RepID=A0A1J5PGJ8_9ZZZZ